MVEISLSPTSTPIADASSVARFWVFSSGSAGMSVISIHNPDEGIVGFRQFQHIDHNSPDARFQFHPLHLLNAFHVRFVASLEKLLASWLSGGSSAFCRI